MCVSFNILLVCVFRSVRLKYVTFKGAVKLGSYQYSRGGDRGGRGSFNRLDTGERVKVV